MSHISSTRARLRAKLQAKQLQQSPTIEKLENQFIALSVSSQEYFPILYVVDSLKDPHNPSQCAGAMFIALMRFHPIKTNFPEEKLAQLHGLWSTLYTFISTKRTDKQLAHLVNKLSNCSCSRTDFHAWNHHDEFRKLREKRAKPDGYDHESEIHSFSRERKSLTWDFLHYTYQVVSWVMSIARSNLVGKGASKGWPTKIADLLPSGPDDLLESLFRWDRFVGRLLSLELLPEVIRLCGPLIRDNIEKHDALAVLILDPLKEALDRVLIALENAPTLPSPDQLRKVECTFDLLARGLIACLDEVLRKPVTRANLLMLPPGGEIKAVQLCSMFLYLFPFLEPHIHHYTSEDITIMTLRIGRHNAELFEMFNMQSPSYPDLPISPTAAENARQYSIAKTVVPTYHTTHDLEGAPVYIACSMLLSRHTKACSGPGCDRTYQDPNVRFKMCARCSAVGYCSGECQLRHWNADKDDDSEEESHKKPCKIMARILKECGGWPTSAGNNENGALYRADEMAPHILTMRRMGRISDDELIYMTQWAERMNIVMNNPVSMAFEDREWAPGYYEEEYEDFLSRVQQLGGPAAVYMDRSVFTRILDHAMGVKMAIERVTLTDDSGNLIEGPLAIEDGVVSESESTSDTDVESID